MTNPTVSRSRRPSFRMLAAVGVLLILPGLWACRATETRPEDVAFSPTAPTRASPSPTPTPRQLAESIVDSSGSQRGNPPIAAMESYQGAQDFITQMDSAIAADPTYPLAYLLRGEAHKSAALPAPYPELDPALPRDEALKSAGLKWTEDQERSSRKAVDDFSQAIRLDPNDGDGYLGRASALDTLDRHREALEDYGAAIRLAPEDGRAWNGRAGVLTELGEYNGALADFDNAIWLGSETALRGRAELHLRQGDYSSALDDYREYFQTSAGEFRATAFFPKSGTGPKLVVTGTGGRGLAARIEPSARASTIATIPEGATIVGSLFHISEDCPEEAGSVCIWVNSNLGDFGVVGVAWLWADRYLPFKPESTSPQPSSTPAG